MYACVCICVPIYLCAYVHVGCVYVGLCIGLFVCGFVCVGQCVRQCTFVYVSGCTFV